MKILFVCTANVCRSPMSEALFNALARDKGLDVRAESAGVAALAGEAITPNARAVLEEVGVYAPEHRARQISAKMLEEADLVLTMGPRHVKVLRQSFGDLSDKIRTLPNFVSSVYGSEEISDPHGGTIAAYRASVRQLLEYLELLSNRFEKGERAVS